MLKLKKWQIAILIASVILFIIEVNVLVNIFIGKSADTGSISDWLSASSDVAMAIAALYAAWLAKNWLKPNLQQQGLPKVVAFLQNELSESLINDFMIINANNIKELSIKIRDNIDSSDEERNQSYIDISNFIKKCSPAKNNKTVNFSNPINFSKRIKEFEWYGFSFKENKAQTVNQILDHKSKLLLCNTKILKELSKFNTQLYSDYIFYNAANRENILDTLDIIIENLDRYSQEQIHNYSELRNLYRTLMSKSPLVTDFFDIKES